MKGWTERRFWRLVRLADERPLSPRQQRALDQLRIQRPDLAAIEAAEEEGLSFLRAQTLDPEPTPDFDQRAIRVIRLSIARQRARAWSPAFVGAGIAALAILAALQLITAPPTQGKVDVSLTEARRAPDATGLFPEIRSAQNRLNP